jgi:hypothetical protein
VSTDSWHGAKVPPSTADGQSGDTTQAEQAAPDAAVPVSRGSPEGRFVGGPGKPLYRQVTDLQSQTAEAGAKKAETLEAKERAEATDQALRENHRGGDRTWLLRPLIPLGTVAEAVTAYIAVEVLVASVRVAEGLSVLTALIGTGMACILANRRLNRHPVPVAWRVVEAIFVVVVSVLRYESLAVQGADLLTAAGAAALAALISALVLVGIEEIVVETRTFAMFISSLRVWWKRWRCAATAARLAKLQARIEAAAGKLQQHFLEFLLKVEGLSLEQARQRAAALKAALTGRES